MPRLRPGRTQFNVANVSEGVMREFDELRIGKGPGGLNIPRWQLFEKIFSEWKIMAQSPQYQSAQPEKALPGANILVERPLSPPAKAQKTEERRHARKRK